MTNHFFSTPWNHIEAGIAFALDLPILMIREEGILDGIFDTESTDFLMHKLKINSDSASISDFTTTHFLNAFNAWFSDVRHRSKGRKKMKISNKM